MRISAELLHQAGQRLNPMEERELDLRDLGIPALENMAVTLDAFDAWDLSNNRLSRLDNFPRLHRLKNLLCAANVIESVDANNMAQNVPNLQSLTLSGNNISQLAEVAKIGTACPKLEFLTLDGNPVTRRQNYRLYAIAKIKSLKVLDFSKIKTAERQAAESWLASPAGAALEGQTVKSFVPGEGLDETARSFAATTFTAEEKEVIRGLLANAESVQDVEDIENAVRRGVMPDLKRFGVGGKLSDIQNREAPPAKRQKVN